MMNTSEDNNNKPYNNMFKDVMVITNPKQNGKTMWLVKKHNIKNGTFINPLKIITSYGIPIKRDLELLPKFINDENISYAIVKVIDDVVEPINLQHYTAITHALKQLNLIYNKKTNEIIKQ